MRRREIPENQPRRNEEHEDIYRYLRALRFFVVDCNRLRELIRNVGEAEFCGGAIRFGEIRRAEFERAEFRRDEFRRVEFRRVANDRGAIRRGLACL